MKDHFNRPKGIPCNSILSMAHAMTYNFFRWGLYAKLGHE